MNSLFSIIPSPVFPMEISTQLNPNYKYADISKDFLEKYVVASSSGLNVISHFYQSNAQITICVDNNIPVEVVGFENFKNKMYGSGVYAIKYHSLNYSCQPLGKNSIFATLNAKVVIGTTTYIATLTIVLKVTGTIPLITNQTLMFVTI